jgi:lipoate-protein ligase A
MFSKDIATSYGQVIKPILKALHSVGIEATFRPLNDLIYKEKKISGNAQTRKGGVLLQHGTIILSVDEEKMFRYLTPDVNKNNDKPYIKSNRSSVRGILQDGVTAQDVMSAIKRELISALRATSARWSDDEVDTAKELAQKYADQEWIAKR